MWKNTLTMKVVLLAVGFLLALAGCASKSEESSMKEAPERDGFQGQMGVMAGDPADYGN